MYPFINLSSFWYEPQRIPLKIIHDSQGLIILFAVCTTANLVDPSNKFSTLITGKIPVC